MARMSNIDKLKAISTPAEEDWLKIAEEWEKEDLYLERSTRIAVSVLSILRDRHMSKQELAEKMGVSAQYVSKIVKGNENLTLETISKLEQALDVVLINVVDQTCTCALESFSLKNVLIWDKIFSAKFSAKSNKLQPEGISYMPFQQFDTMDVTFS